MAAPQNDYAFDYEAMRQAAEHWRLRDQERERKARAVRGKRYDEAETKDRLTKWVNRTLRHVKGGVRAHPGALPGRLSELVDHESYTEDEIDNDLVERVIGETRDFLAVAFLERAIQAMRSVGRIETRLGNGRKGYGTGFLVSPHLLLTNHHVLKAADHARASVIEFDYQVDRIDQPLAVQRFALDPDAFFLNDEALDFALVAVAPTSARGRPLTDYGWCPLVKEEGKIRIGECINIIQHPRGEMKQVVIRENSLLDLPEKNGDALDRFAHYEADTEPGSSGSPVFNDLWEVVALHHSGVPKTDARGRFLDTRDNVWQKGDDPLRLAWVANEGIRVSRLVDFIEKANVRPHEVLLRAELLTSREPPSFLGSRSEIVVDGSPKSVSILPTSGTVSITIPLQISVSLGAPALAEAPGARLEGKPEPAALEAIEPDPDYQDRPGYDPHFLRFSVPLPKLTSATRPKAVQVPGVTGPSRHELKYHHFSVIMNGERRLALMAAVNYDATAKFTHTREKVRERWMPDPRIDRTLQCEEAHYANPDIDRGHLVRRADAGWGSTPAEAKRANDDTFHFTNCAPQHEVFNQATKAHRQGLLLWGSIEEHIAQQARENRRRLCIFNGPIFRRDDPTHRGLQIPREFWKVVVFENDVGEPVALAFRLSQTDLVKALPPEEFAVGPYQPFQVTVRTIEELTKLNFGNLRDYDPLEDEAHENLFEGGFDFVTVDKLRDIAFGRREAPVEPDAVTASGHREIDQQITETISNAPDPRQALCHSR
jgi:endonuclease G